MTLEGYRNDLKPVRCYLGGKRLQQIVKADGDALVELMLTKGRGSPKHYQPGSLSSRVAELIGQHPEGISASALARAFPGEVVHTCLSGLVRAARITRPRRAVYVLVDSVEVDPPPRGVKPVSVRSTLTTFGMVVQSFVDQGMLPRNVIALVERPADAMTDEDADTAKSWTGWVAESMTRTSRRSDLWR